ncbi:MAG: hypothetical protein ACLR4A_19495 [Christensenellales bacterium]
MQTGAAFYFMLETRRHKRLAAQNAAAQKVPAAKPAAESKEKSRKSRKNEPIRPKSFSELLFAQSGVS